MLRLNIRPRVVVLFAAKRTRKAAKFLRGINRLMNERVVRREDFSHECQCHSEFTRQKHTLTDTCKTRMNLSGTIHRLASQ